jgi:predicted nucleic acid-binding protein
VTSIVIDANAALALAVPLPYSDRVMQLVEECQEQEMRFAVPALWGYGVVSGLRNAVSAGMLTGEDADMALRYLWALGIEEGPATVEGHRRALLWSERLGQMVAYDAQYLVAAEELKVSLWRADRPVSKGDQAAGAEWVHWIGEGA